MRLKIMFLVCFVIGSMVSMAQAQYLNLDRHGNYRGHIDRTDTRIDFYDRHNMPSGWIDRSSGATYDRHNNFKGWIIDSDPDRN